MRKHLFKDEDTVTIAAIICFASLFFLPVSPFVYIITIGAGIVVASQFIFWFIMNIKEAMSDNSPIHPNERTGYDKDAL